MQHHAHAAAALDLGALPRSQTHTDLFPDNVLMLGEQVTGHGLRTGRGPRLSEDENLLIDLLQARWTGPVPYACSDAIACAFCYAVRSTQILLAQALEGRRGATSLSIRDANPRHC
jgi:hypothetical protein